MNDLTLDDSNIILTASNSGNFEPFLDNIICWFPWYLLNIADCKSWPILLFIRSLLSSISLSAALKSACASLICLFNFFACTDLTPDKSCALVESAIVPPKSPVLISWISPLNVSVLPANIAAVLPINGIAVNILSALVALPNPPVIAPNVLSKISAALANGAVTGIFFKIEYWASLILSAPSSVFCNPVLFEWSADPIVFAAALATPTIESFLLMNLPNLLLATLSAADIGSSIGVSAKSELICSWEMFFVLSTRDPPIGFIFCLTPNLIDVLGIKLLDNENISSGLRPSNWLLNIGTDVPSPNILYSLDIT